MKKQQHHQFCATLHLLDGEGGGRGEKVSGTSLSPISYSLPQTLFSAGPDKSHLVQMKMKL